MGLFSFLKGGPSLRELLKNGAVIIDVRTPNEYDRGRLPESINIPVDRIPTDAKRILVIKRPVIFCCNSGDRSAQAVSTIKKMGKKNVYNGGDWEKLYLIYKSI